MTVFSFNSKTLPALAPLLATILIAGCADTRETTVATEPSARPVKLIEIRAAATNQSTSYPAVISSSRTANLSFLVGGLIEKLPISESGEVSEGDLIASLDPRDFVSAVHSARAVFNTAEEEYQRGKRLMAQDAISTSSLEQRKSQRDVARSQLESAEKALEDSVLRAPFSGLVASVPVRQLQTVAAGTAIATIIDLSELNATINVPASVIAHVRIDEKPAAAILLEAAPERTIEAFFSEANPIADAASQTYAVTFSFAAPNDLLVLPGMNATIIIRSTPTDNHSPTHLGVPLAAVLSDGNGQYVWRLDPESMTVSRSDVKVAPGIGETLAVTEGLALGDQIVGAGGAYLSEGARVSSWKK